MPCPRLHRAASRGVQVRPGAERVDRSAAREATDVGGERFPTVAERVRGDVGSSGARTNHRVAQAHRRWWSEDPRDGGSATRQVPHRAARVERILERDGARAHGCVSLGLRVAAPSGPRGVGSRGRGRRRAQPPAGSPDSLGRSGAAASLGGGVARGGWKRRRGRNGVRSPADTDVVVPDDDERRDANCTGAARGTARTSIRGDRGDRARRPAGDGRNAARGDVRRAGLAARATSSVHACGNLGRNGTPGRGRQAARPDGRHSQGRGDQARAVLRDARQVGWRLLANDELSRLRDEPRALSLGNAGARHRARTPPASATWGAQTTVGVSSCSCS